ncbi:MAG: DUF5020 family protein [Bacteroidaceae bacterium]|nr:DUF5020 family protein [Bacteroidaceae bacterium]
MKKITRFMALVGLMLCLPLVSLKAQNLQVFYDTGREQVTTTLEMFRPDAFGSTFYFVDMDYSPKAIGAYTEIARELCFWQDTDWNWLSVHIEFNGGLSTGLSFNNSWLAGLTYSGHSADFSKTWSVSAMYKAIPGTIGLKGGKQPHNFQITGVWGINFLNGWCSFSGFADFWREARMWQGTEFIFLAEPQLWVNLSKIPGMGNVPLSVGGEVELSSNFVEKGFRVMPAIGAKWTF